MVSGLFHSTFGRFFPGFSQTIKGAGHRFGLAALALSLSTIAFSMPTSAVARPAVSVEVNHSTRLALRGAAASVIVGNPAIADVTVIDARTVYVMGRGPGSTTISVLDANGRPVWEGLVAVNPARNAGMVTVYRGRARTDMQCSGGCTPIAPAASQGATNPSGTAVPPPLQTPVQP
jgi:hypothetical protein